MTVSIAIHVRTQQTGNQQNANHQLVLANGACPEDIYGYHPRRGGGNNKWLKKDYTPQMS
jgi:hypothetical protein